MTLFAYTATTPRTYPEFGIVAEVGDVVEFGTVTMPNDGRWGPAATGAVVTKQVGIGSPNYQLPGAPQAGEALVWDADLGQYVPTDLSETYALVGTGGLALTPVPGTDGLYGLAL